VRGNAALASTAGAARACTSSQNEANRLRNWLLLLAAATLAAWLALTNGRADSLATSPSARALGAVEPLSSPAAPARPSAIRAREGFVGSQGCAPCHQAQSEAYFGSHHAKALVVPRPELEKTQFDGRQLTSKLGGQTEFSLQDGAPVVTTSIASGKVATLPIKYVSGVWPLEQYVVATERGKLQSLGVVWDSRTLEAGGSQWFHVYGKAGVSPNDPLFFTAPAQNWNHVCADCHSTWVERRYDATTDSFDTRWAELSVGCEACHGPGAEHVRTAKTATPQHPPAALPVRLASAAPWAPSATGSPVPRARDDVEVEVCAPCHSRRTPLKEGFLASDPFLDSFQPDLLRPARYHADGQVEGEVYEWGSFLQSRMYHAGVTCSDCHDAHSGKLLAPDNALCGRCHEPRRFDVPAHSHHEGGAAARAPRCIDCHMPPATFMQIDERRDHSLRIPRPDLSVEYGTPNACNGCHGEKSATWARDAVAKWTHGSTPRPHFVEALAKDRQGALDAPRALRALGANAQAPAIARATALERLGSYAGDQTRQALQSALASSDGLVVYGAVLGAAQLPPPQRLALLLPVLEHPLRAVRVAVGKALAGAPIASLPERARVALDRAFAEVEQSFVVGASQPQTHVEQSAFELARGRLQQAEVSLQTALRLQPCLEEAQLNLADLARQKGDEAAAERAIRATLQCNPQYASAHHALGLWQIRARQGKAAIPSLRKAARLVPHEPRFSYVLAVALASTGERDEAIRTLEATLDARPNDANSLQALATYLREAGESERSKEIGRRLNELSRE
jgi:tetratricopeptide (TPR) repeat protein